MSGCALVSVCMRHDITWAYICNVPDVVDKCPFVVTFARMSNTEKPDVATDDSGTVESRLAFADKAEFLLVRILAALGYQSDKLTPSSLIAGIAAWLTLFATMKREPGGSYASFWARAFLDVCKDLPVDDAAECADKMTAHFAKRFPPMLDDVLLDEQERDTQSDIQVLTAELDKQVQLVWQLEAEHKALLKANEHHASELAACRIQLDERTAQRDQLMRDVYGALVPLAKPEHIEAGQRWAFVMHVNDFYDDESGWRVGFDNSRMTWPVNDLQSNLEWAYLGTDKV